MVGASISYKPLSAANYQKPNPTSKPNQSETMQSLSKTIYQKNKSTNKSSKSKPRIQSHVAYHIHKKIKTNQAPSHPLPPLPFRREWRSCRRCFPGRRGQAGPNRFSSGLEDYFNSKNVALSKLGDFLIALKALNIKEKNSNIYIYR